MAFTEYINKTIPNRLEARDRMSIVGFYFVLELYKYYAGINEIDFTVSSPEFVSICSNTAGVINVLQTEEEYQG